MPALRALNLSDWLILGIVLVGVGAILLLDMDRLVATRSFGVGLIALGGWLFYSRQIPLKTIENPDDAPDEKESGQAIIAAAISAVVGIFAVAAPKRFYEIALWLNANF